MFKCRLTLLSKRLLLAVVVCCALFYIWPLPTALQQEAIQPPLRVLDRNGILLYEARQENYGSQTSLRYENIPSNIIDALLSIEDRTFFLHQGVSIKATVRAFVQNIQSRRVVSGGSTITQQLVRSRLRSSKRDIVYKVREAVLAIKLELHTTKEQILESYLNTAYFGHQAYGIASASEIYFGKSVHELSIAEVSMLVGLLKYPSSRDPFVNFDLAKKRQEVVLRAMVDNKKLSKEVFFDVVDEPIILAKDRISMKAPHFVMWILSQNSQKTEGELRTTLDYNLQREIEFSIQNQLQKLEDKNVTSAAVVVLDAKTGELLTMIGSADYFDIKHDGQVNVALSKRQPGSTLKPFTYALAIENGDTAATVVSDTEVHLLTQEGNPYIPRNFDYEHHGLVRYREALANSYNIPAIKVAQKVGVSNLLHVLSKAGITTLTKSAEHYGLALTLGDGEVTLLELTKAYGVFATLGRELNVSLLLDEQKEAIGDRVFSEETSWIVSDILADTTARIPEFGIDNLLIFDFPVAAKTGTTRNSRDNWLVGYTADRIVGVWVGNADNTPMRQTTGITGAGPIFRDAVQIVSNDSKPSWFEKPSTIERVEICTLSGQLPSAHCKNTMFEYFKSGTAPTTEDSMHVVVPIDTRNGLLGHDCPKEFISMEVRVDFPEELDSWALQNGYQIVPQKTSPFCLSDGNQEYDSSALVITNPNVGDSFQLDPTVPDEHEKIVLKVQTRSAEQIQWYINDALVCTTMDLRCEWQPEVGAHTLKVSSGESEDTVVFEVIN